MDERLPATALAGPIGTCVALPFVALVATVLAFAFALAFALLLGVSGIP